MKSFALTLVASTVVLSASVPSALLNLRNSTLLLKDVAINPLESIAHIATFDEIPIFGGHELRQQMLEEDKNKSS